MLPDAYLAVGGYNQANGNSNYVNFFRKDSSALTYLTAKQPGNGNFVNNITAIAWDPTGTYCAVGSLSTSGYNLTIFKLGGSHGSETFTELSQPSTVPDGNVTALCWSPDGTRLCLGVASATSYPIWFYNVDHGTDAVTFDRKYNFLPSNTNPPTCLAWSADGQSIYGGSHAYAGNGLPYVHYLALQSNMVDFAYSSALSTAWYTTIGTFTYGPQNVAVSGNTIIFGRLDNSHNGFTEVFTQSGSSFTHLTNNTPKSLGPFVAVAPSTTNYAVQELYSSGTDADQLRMYGVSGSNTARLSPGADNAPLSSIASGAILGGGVAFTSDGSTLAVASQWQSSADNGRVLLLYGYDGSGTLTLLGTGISGGTSTWFGPALSSTNPQYGSVVAWSPTPIISQATIAATTGNDSALFSGLEGENATIAVTTGNATSNFIEGDDGKEAATLGPAIANFIEGDSGVMAAVAGGAFGTISAHKGLEYAANIYEKLLPNDTAIGNLDSSVTVTELAKFAASVLLAFNDNIDEVLSLTETLEGTQILVNVVVDHMVMSGLATSTLEALHQISELLRIYEEVDRGFVLDVGEILNLADVTDAQIQALASIVEGMLFDAQVSASVLVIAAVTENVNLADQVLTTAVLQSLLSEGILFELTFASDFGIYETWVINTQTGAPSMYKAFNFNSYANKRGLSLGASDAGLFQLDADDDDGQNIPASFTTGKLRFGTSQLKNVPSVYLAFNSSGKLALKVVSEQDGKPIERWFKLEWKGGSAREGRFKLGRGDKSPYWQFTLSNMQGSDFEIDQMDYDVIRLSRRI